MLLVNGCIAVLVSFPAMLGFVKDQWVSFSMNWLGTSHRFQCRCVYFCILIDAPHLIFVLSRNRKPLRASCLLGSTQYFPSFLTGFGSQRVVRLDRSMKVEISPFEIVFALGAVQFSGALLLNHENC